MKKYFRTIAGLLAMVLCLGLIPMAFAEETNGPTQSKEPVNYVIVLDISPSTKGSDEKKVTEQSGKLLIDHLPVENAQVGVVTFGYKDTSKTYKFKAIKDYTNLDAQVIRELVPLQGTANQTEKNNLVGIVDMADQLAELAGKQQMDGQSPVGLSIAAAVDMLVRAGSAKGNACIIVISDGVRRSRNATNGDYEKIQKEVALLAGEMEWPIYCLRLAGDSVDISAEDAATAQKQMSETAKMTNAFIDVNDDGQISDDEKGAYEITGLDQVTKAILQVLAQYSGGKLNKLVLDGNGYVSDKFEIPELTSEATVTVTGKGLEKVKISDSNGNLLCEASDTTEVPGKYTTTKRTGPMDDYITVKMICPEPGEVLVEVFGQANATIYSLTCAANDVDLKLDLQYRESEADEWKPVDSDKALNREVQLRFEAFFEYANRRYTNCKVYQESFPELKVKNKSTEAMPHTFQMSGDANGYFYEIPMSEFGKQDSLFSACADVFCELLGEDVKYSNEVAFKTMDVPSKKIGDFKDMVRVGLNEMIEVDLGLYIQNEDGDALNITVECESNSGISFEYEPKEQFALEINSGMVPGEHQILIKLEDPTGDVHELHMPLEVTMQEIQGGEDIRLVLASEKFPDILNFMLGDAEIPENNSRDITDMFYAEGLSVEIREVYIGDDSVVSCDKVDDSWMLISKGAGKSEVTVCVTAEVLNSEGELEVFNKLLNVEVVSQKAIFWSIWRIPAIILLALVILVIWILIVRKRREGLKGLWKVVFSQSGEDHLVSEPVDLYRYSDRKEITLKELMEDQIQENLDVLRSRDTRKAANVQNAIKYWETDMGRVKLCATKKSRGFEVMLAKDARDNVCKLKYAEKDVSRKRTYINDQELCIAFEEGSEKIVLTMEMTFADYND